MPRTKGSTSEDPKPRAAMSAYAFFVQTCREEHRRQHPEENVEFVEFSKKCAERWKTMSEKEKKRFNQMADVDRKRYAVEEATFAAIADKGKRGRKKTKKVKDPNAPRRSMSAFFWFSKEVRPKVRAANPEFSVGEIAKELGRRWSEATPEVKSKYEVEAEKDRERYSKEKKEYQEAIKGGVPLAHQQDSDIEEDDEELESD